MKQWPVFQFHRDAISDCPAGKPAWNLDAEELLWLRQPL